MKKLSFFLMAMLFSVMSFAAEATIDFSSQNIANQTAMETVQVNDDVTITFAGGGNSNVPKYYSSGTAVRMYPKNSFTVTTTTGKLTKIVITFGSGDGTLSIASNVGNYASGTWAGEETSVTVTVDPKATSGHRRIQAIAVTYGEVSADYIAAPAISGDVDFIESTEVSIAAGEGLKVYYTLDGTDPTNASPEYTASFEVKETTTVKAIAYNGENASEVTTQTFTKATQVTCAEAKEIALKVSSNNVPTELTYVVKGYVTNVVSGLSSGKQTFWIADTKDGGQVFEAYYCFISKAAVVGDYVQLFGKLTKYNTTPEMSNGQATILPAPVAKFNVTATAENGTVEGAGEYEEGKEATLTATANEGYEFVNWTVGDSIVSTENPYTFAVTADVALVANFKEAEAEEIMFEPFVFNNLAISVQSDDHWVLTAHNETLDVMLGVNPNNATLVEGSQIFFGETELPILETVSITMEYTEFSPETFIIRVVVDLAGEKMGLELIMYAGTSSTEPVTIAVTGAVASVTNDGWLLINGTWNELPFMLKVAGYEDTPFKEYTGIQVGEMEYGVWEQTENDFGFSELVTVIKTGDNLDIMGEFFSNNTGTTYNVSVSASFAAADTKHTVTIVTLPEGAGIVTGAGEYEDGAEVTVTAEENEGWYFMGWYDATTSILLAEDYEYTFQALGDVNLIAYFIPALEGMATDLVIGENTLTASTELSLGKLNMNLVLGEGAEGVYKITEESTLTIGDKAVTLMVGIAMVIPEDQMAVAIMIVEYNEELYYIEVLMVASETGVDNITTTVAPAKVIKNGQLIIIKNGVEYNVQGAKL